MFEFDSLYPRRETGFEREMSLDIHAMDFDFSADDFDGPIIIEADAEDPPAAEPQKSKWKGKRFVSRVTARGIVVETISRRDGSTDDVLGCTWGVFDKKTENFLEWDSPHKSEAVAYANQLNFYPEI